MTCQFFLWDIHHELHSFGPPLNHLVRGEGGGLAALVMHCKSPIALVVIIAMMHDKSFVLR